MNLRHAAALALVVWYMMVPPVRGAPGEILKRAPLSEWDVWGQYDSKAECENSVPSDRDVQENEKQCSNGDCAINVALPGYGRCIVADDPRLKKNEQVQKENARSAKKAPSN